jgi:hypothetical protein
VTGPRSPPPAPPAAVGLRVLLLLERRERHQHGLVAHLPQPQQQAQDVDVVLQHRALAVVLGEQVGRFLEQVVVHPLVVVVQVLRRRARWRRGVRW